MSEFTRGFIAGLEAAAGFADYMGGDRYQRADYSRRDPAGRLQQMIEAQHLRARGIAMICRLRASELLQQEQSQRVPEASAKAEE